MDQIGQMYKTNYRDQDNKGDLIIFQNIYIKIYAEEESYFSIMVKPEEKFKVLIPMESELVTVERDKD